jgi:cell division protein FtsI/penicillin-binding protein 2/cell division protein FtsW (lipid II flippase)
MAITKSWERDVSLALAADPAPSGRRVESLWLAGASLLVACGLALVGFAKIGQIPADSHPIDLNAVSSAQELLPYLARVIDPADQEATASRIFAYLETHRPVPNVGALAGIRVGARRLPIQRLKSLMTVRTLDAFLKECVLWCLVYFAAFWAVHIVWSARKFRGDQVILPALHLLTGIGLILAVSLRDPLRDTLEFRKFAWGVALGCLMLLLPLLRVFNRQRFSRWIYTPLLAALALFVLLLAFGSGPTGSDARVNLGPFQPVELIKILIVFFLAGYFAHKWQWLRDLQTRRLRWLNFPRLAQTLPVMAGVAIPLAMFFLLKDLGPALITGFLFLTMFAVARNRAGLALAGLTILIGGVALGYHFGKPNTVVERVSIWLSPWDNDERGGDQLAHSLWAFSTGGALGSGPGLGDPAMIPAGHTDLVLPAIAEEWGFPGVAAIGLLFLLLVQRTFRAALNAPDELAMFLSLGLGALIAIEMLLISGGVLGAIPLSGVVSPFLSSGNTAMLANFLIFAVVLGISSQGPRADDALAPLFRRPVRIAGVVLATLALALLGRAAYFQVFHSQEFLIHDARVIEEDGVKRAQVNPRLSSLARAIPRGTIFDRNGVPLATSSCSEIEQHRASYAALGVPSPGLAFGEACSQIEARHYPFGPATVHLLGDLRTAENFRASNASLIEHDSNSTLQGFTDLHDLGSLVQYRHQPSNPAMRALLEKNRDVHTTIDVRLQLRVVDLLRKRLDPVHKDGAVVIMDPQTGDVLALASYPMPQPGSTPTRGELLDRARYGQYPPGSVFKLVTAIAALRLDPDLRNRTYQCIRLKDGRAGNLVKGWSKPIRDDVGDHAHGTLNMERALAVSCNAYFAQLGTYDVGASALHETAALLEIPAGELPEIRQMMPFAAYGQGPVLVTPFKMARVAATIAAGGSMPEGRWILGDSNPRKNPPLPILAAELSDFLQGAMRLVVESGTARDAMKGLTVSVAGKTGTAQVEQGAPHSWFAGFAPYGGDPAKQIAFAVVVEHGGYGSLFAAPLAREIVEAARDLGII